MNTVVAVVVLRVKAAATLVLKLQRSLTIIHVPL